MRSITGFLCVVAALALAAPASGVAPQLLSVTVQDRHPAASFSAPHTDGGAMYFATKPDRATDGKFLDENVKMSDLLTDSELQTGRWLYENQLDPGTYWVMLSVSADFGVCWIWDTAMYNPACAHGYSNVTTLVVPRKAVATKRGRIR